MEEKYLPIGTVCRLKNATKDLMIMGFCVSKAEEQNKVYDYIGCMHPVGFISPEINFLFNHDQIDEVLYKGFENENEKLFKEQLKSEMVNNNQKNEVSNISSEDQVMNNKTFNNEGQLNENNNTKTSIPTFNTLNLNQQDNNQ